MSRGGCSRQSAGSAASIPARFRSRGHGSRVKVFRTCLVVEKGDRDQPINHNRRLASPRLTRLSSGAKESIPPALGEPRQEISSAASIDYYWLLASCMFSVEKTKDLAVRNFFVGVTARTHMCDTA
eukprot:gene13975-biopygen3799